MKKKVLLTLGLLFLLVGCGPKEPDPIDDPDEPVEPIVEPEPSHAHAFESTYTIEDDVHYKKATCGHDVKKDYCIHTYGSDNKCTFCGYKREVASIVPEENRIINLRTLGEKYENIYGVVFAVNGEGCLISDGIDAVYVYGHTEFAVGDYISVTGTYTAYKGIKEFEKASTCTKLSGEKPEINIKEYELTAELLQNLSFSTSKVLPLAKFKWNAQVWMQGQYKTFNVENGDLPIEMPKLVNDPFTAGNYYDITGYYMGASEQTNGYYSFMLDNATMTKEGTYVEHKCQHVCEVCGGCKDNDCKDYNCSTKCNCNIEIKDSLTLDFSTGNNWNIADKNTISLEEQTVPYAGVLFGYKGVCRNVTDYGSYLFMKGKDMKSYTCFYNKTALPKEIKSITVEPTSSASGKVLWSIKLGNEMMDTAVSGTTKTGAKESFTVEAGEASYTYFNISTLDKSNNLQIKKIIIEFK